ncbi:class I SAM-dependent methyltransferase [Pseudoalteromonas sp. Scap03]|uniref:class I SAM-dependent methyltransferase n=1 Tax=Pseudoalteromonas sp. Scap03 TaxID=2585187 RepID=UPI0015BAFF86|nr:class I SAM-dependent methyltransferase [Pseudoalteromonas sp. Scap03]NWL17414.1 class I SAM-dependent methyltransferase [Pseudoalteromonas sp. Scap03]
MKTYETKDGVEDYIRMCDGYDNSKFQNELLNHLKEGSSLLEVGMGPGNDFEWLSNTYRVTGSDYSKEFIEKAKARFSEGEFIILDAVSLKSDKKYDGIYSCKVYQHFELDLIEKSLKINLNCLMKMGLLLILFGLEIRFSKTGT